MNMLCFVALVAAVAHFVEYERALTDRQGLTQAKFYIFRIINGTAIQFLKFRKSKLHIEAKDRQS